MKRDKNPKIFAATLAGENTDSSKGAVGAHSHFSTGSIRDDRASDNSASAGRGVPAWPLIISPLLSSMQGF